MCFCVFLCLLCAVFVCVRVVQYKHSHFAANTIKIIIRYCYCVSLYKPMYISISNYYLFTISPTLTSTFLSCMRYFSWYMLPRMAAFMISVTIRYTSRVWCLKETGTQFKWYYCNHWSFYDVYIDLDAIIYIIHHTSYIIHHTSYIIHHTSYIIHHTSYIIHHTYIIIHHAMSSYIIRHIMTFYTISIFRLYNSPVPGISIFSITHLRRVSHKRWRPRTPRHTHIHTHHTHTHTHTHKHTCCSSSTQQHRTHTHTHTNTHTHKHTHTTDTYTNSGSSRTNTTHTHKHTTNTTNPTTEHTHTHTSAHCKHHGNHTNQCCKCKYSNTTHYINVNINTPRSPRQTRSSCCSKRHRHTDKQQHTHRQQE